MDDIQDIKKYYQSNSEIDRHKIQQLEFAVTCVLLKKYLPASASILELGSGAGYYTEFLTNLGHQVTAVELTESLTETNQKRSWKKNNTPTFITADARDFRKHTQKTFDVVLVMGPLYHLTDQAERKCLIKDTKAAVKSNGIVITTHLSRVGLFSYMLTRFPDWADNSPAEAKQIQDLGYLPDHPRNGEFRGYFTELNEIKKLHEDHGLQIMHMHSQDPGIGSVDELFNRLPKDLQNKWVEILADISSDILALGSGRSIMCISKA